MLALTVVECLMRQLAPYALIYLLAIACAAGLATQSQAADAPLQVQIGYLGYRPDPGPLLSNVIPEPVDAGGRGFEDRADSRHAVSRRLRPDRNLGTLARQPGAPAQAPVAPIEAAAAA